MSRFLAVCIWLGALSIPAAAQSVVRGVVLDGGGHPIASANVLARTSSDPSKPNRFITSVRTNAQGEFIFTDLASGGPYIFTARKIGYGAATSNPVTLNGRDTTTLRFELTVTSLSPVVITAPIRKEYYIDAAEIKKHAVMYASDLMSYRPRMFGDSYTGCTGRTAPRFQVYINGSRYLPDEFETTRDLLNRLYADDIAQMRYINCWDKQFPELRNSLIVVLKPGAQY